MTKQSARRAWLLRDFEEEHVEDGKSTVLAQVGIAPWVAEGNRGS